MQDLIDMYFKVASTDSSIEISSEFDYSTALKKIIPKIESFNQSYFERTLGITSLYLEEVQVTFGSQHQCEILIRVDLDV